MKKFFILFTIATMLFSLSVMAQKGKKNKLENEIDSLSYAIGVSFGHSLKDQHIPELKIEKIALAIDDILNTDEQKLTIEESQKIIMEYLTALQAKQKQKNLIKANEFLEDNRKNPNVVVLPSGLQYEVLREGSGQSPTAANRVKTHYEGTLLDGTVFDSSYDRGEPITFGVTQVIKGWQEALQLMKPGSKWKIYVHPDLGYGERSKSPIPANSVLIFEMELLSIE